MRVDLTSPRSRKFLRSCAIVFLAIAVPALFSRPALSQDASAFSDIGLAQSSEGDLLRPFDLALSAPQLSDLTPVNVGPQLLERPARLHPPVSNAWPRHAVHLASYRLAESARQDWSMLAGRHTALAQMEPVLIHAEFSGQGHFLQLLALPNPNISANDLKSICTGMRTVGDYCQPMTVNTTDVPVPLFEARSPLTGS